MGVLKEMPVVEENRVDKMGRRMITPGKNRGVFRLYAWPDGFLPLGPTEPCKEPFRLGAGGSGGQGKTGSFVGFWRESLHLRSRGYVIEGTENKECCFSL